MTYYNIKKFTENVYNVRKVPDDTANFFLVLSPEGNYYINENEGDLAKRLAVLVSGEILLQVSKELKIDKYIKVGPKVNFKGTTVTRTEVPPGSVGTCFGRCFWYMFGDLLVNVWCVV